MYLERWNDAYWLTEFYVQPAKDVKATIHEEVFRDLQYELYPDGELKEGKSVMVRVENRYFELAPTRDTPTGILEVPEADLDELRIRNPPTKYPVLVVEPWFQDYVAWDEAAN